MNDDIETKNTWNGAIVDERLTSALLVLQELCDTHRYMIKVPKETIYKDVYAVISQLQMFLGDDLLQEHHRERLNR